MKMYIGVTNDDELLYIEWDKVDNEQRKTFSLSGGTYRDPKTEAEGRDEARKVLRTRDYWEDLDMIKGESFLNDYINFDEVAEYVLNSDGWENTNGEYSHFGEVQNEEIYLSFSSCGQHQEKREDIKELWISEKEFKAINSLWDKYHLKPLRINEVDFMSLLFDKYKGLCSDEEALIKFLKCIKWRE